MQEILDFLKKCGTFYLATMDGEHPRVRPFGAVCLFESKLCIVTNNQKPVFRQMLANPNIELCGCCDGAWMRVQGKAVLDSRREARVAMIEDNPTLKQMYHVDDGLMEVLSIENPTATLYSFSEEPKQLCL